MAASRNISWNHTKAKSSTIQTTKNQFKVHRPALLRLILTLMVTACMMFVLSALVPGNVSKVFAQDQQHSSSKDSDQKLGTSTDSTSSMKDRVTIDLASVEFAPLTDNENNQLKVIINYHTNDPSLVNTPMAGTMKVYGSDGNVIKTSKIGNGYVLGQSGPMQFATTFTDKKISNVKAEIFMTDPTGEKISNTLTSNASLSN